MLKINAQVVKDADGYKLAVQVVTSNELEVAHTKILGLASDAVESLVMMRAPFEVEFADIADPVSSPEAIEIVRKQNEEKAAKEAADAVAAAAAAEATPAVVEGEIVA